MTHKQSIAWAGEKLEQTPELFSIDASSLHISETADSIFDGLTDVSEEVKNSPEYGAEVAKRLAERNPYARELAEEIRRRIDSDIRFVVVDGFGFEKLKPETRDAFVLAMSSLVGTPTKTDQAEGKVIWDVTPREYLDHCNTTFSEHSGEAAFHTDSQFIDKPELYFSLWSLKHASDGGGINGLIDAQMITRRMLELADGAEMMDILTQTEFPFRVPTVFTAERSDDVKEVLMAPIFSNVPYIRYREDTLQKGLIAKDMQLDPRVQSALGSLKKIIGSEDLILQHFLKEGQVLFANNHELLHNRTSFIDQKRHLLRVRMNEVTDFNQ